MESLLILLLLLALPLASILTLFRGYKYYAKVYKTLENRKFYKNYNNSQVYSRKYGEKEDGFVWFIYENDFFPTKLSYLIAPISYFDPYSLYWLIKYRRWFKKNVNINELPSF